MPTLDDATLLPEARVSNVLGILLKLPEDVQRFASLLLFAAAFRQLLKLRKSPRPICAAAIFRDLQGFARETKGATNLSAR